MDNLQSSISKKATKSAIVGCVIAVLAVIVATILTTWFAAGNISPESLIHTQKTNAAIWMLDLMPFAFMLWGQYVGSALVEQAVEHADTMIIDQTHEYQDKVRQLREQIKEEQNLDALTQLPNISQFLQVLDRQLQTFAGTQAGSGSFIQTLSGFIRNDPHAPQNLAVILLDINHFREINSSLGAHHGDALLKEISNRLKDIFSDSKMLIARVGGDDFALLAKGCNESAVIRIIDRIHELFEKAFNLNGISIVVETSIGVSLYPQHGDSSKEMLQHAEVAMYACKNDAAKYVFYTPALNMNDLEDLILKTELRRAFDNHELCLHYQPKIDALNRVHEVEALVRWNHPTKGLIPPDKFIPMIVKKRLNGELLQRILNIALQQAKEWEKDHLSLRIALNLTAFDLLEPGLPAMIKGKLSEYNLKADVLKLEITETSLVENQALALQTLNAFAEMGIPTSIDDFGTGYSSLAYLSSLPINEIKIDRSFVIGMSENHRNDKIVQAIIALAHSLSLYTVAEGVEDAGTMGLLKDLDCDFIQGYHISRPLAGHDLTNWLKHWDEKHPSLVLKKSHSAY